MAPRLELQTLLETLCDHVYFQPPTNTVIEYPCIIYKRDAEDAKFAGNRPYRRTKRYQVTIIDRDPDSPIPDKVADLPMSTFNRFYTAENLNHDVYTVFF
jgi:hypothetical protein